MTDVGSAALSLTHIVYTRLYIGMQKLLITSFLFIINLGLLLNSYENKESMSQLRETQSKATQGWFGVSLSCGVITVPL